MTLTVMIDPLWLWLIAAPVIALCGAVLGWLLRARMHRCRVIFHYGRWMGTKAALRWPR